MDGRTDALHPGYLTTAEVAREIRMTPEYVSRKCHSGELRAAKLGNTWRIPVAAVTEFMATRAPEPPPEPVQRKLTPKQRRAVAQRNRTTQRRT